MQELSDRARAELETLRDAGIEPTWEEVIQIHSLVQQIHSPSNELLSARGNPTRIPGAILWPEDDMPDNVKDSIIGQVPMKRAGEPGDIADCVLYLVRDARYVTGQIIAVDGGRSIGW